MSGLPRIEVTINLPEYADVPVTMLVEWQADGSIKQTSASGEKSATVFPKPPCACCADDPDRASAMVVACAADSLQRLAESMAEEIVASEGGHDFADRERRARRDVSDVRRPPIRRRPGTHRRHH